jgi:hypothetical protein
MKKVKLTLIVFGLAFCNAIHAQTFLTNGLVAYYSFSGNANDASGSGNNGTTQNVNFVTDRYGSVQGALTCSNASSCIIVADSPSLEINNHLTMSAWINVATNQAGGGVAIKGVVGDFSNFGLSVFRSGTNLTFTYDKTSGIAGPTAPSLSNGRWQQIVVAISEPDNAMKFYVNGQLVTTPIVTYAGSFDTNNVSGVIDASEFGNLYLGNNNSDGLAGGSFAGAIDDVRIYNRTLSDSEVQQLYQAESTPNVNLVKAVTVSFGNLSIGTNYQLQVTTDITSWTNFGTPFTATNTFLIYSNYWNVSDWNQLFFRLH